MRRREAYAFSDMNYFDLRHPDTETLPSIASHVRSVAEYVPSGTDCSSMRPIDAFTEPRRRISSVVCMCVCVCVCVKERESEFVCVSERVCVRACVRE
jgi:hypothetical protein